MIRKMASELTGGEYLDLSPHLSPERIAEAGPYGTVEGLIVEEGLLRIMVLLDREEDTREGYDNFAVAPSAFIELIEE